MSTIRRLFENFVEKTPDKTLFIFKDEEGDIHLAGRKKGIPPFFHGMHVL